MREKTLARRYWPHVTAALAAVLISLAWASSSPVGSSPDESNHITYSYGIVSGEALPWNMEFERDSAGRPFTRVSLPVTLQDFPFPRCYTAHDNLPSDCELTSSRKVADGLVDSSGTLVQGTHMTAYPPLYYAFSGSIMHASLAAGLSGPHTLLLTRVASGLLFFAMVGAAVNLLARRFPRPGIYVGLLAACTPMAIFMGTSINPNGFEIASAILAAACIVAVRHDLAVHGRTRRRLDTALVAALFALVWTRPLSVAWAVCLAVVLLLPSVRGLGLPLLRMRRTTVGAIAALMAAGVAWMLWTDRIRQSAGLSSDVWDDFPFGLRSLLVLLKFGDLVQQSVGLFGWGDTPLPLVVVILWILIVAITTTTMAAGRIRPSTGLGLASAFFALSALVVFAHSMIGAFGWQGRYWLPAIAASFVLAIPSMQDRSAGKSLRRYRATIAALLLLAINFFALVWHMWRYIYGYDIFFVRFDAIPYPNDSPGWYPPGGPTFVMLCGLAGIALLAVVISRTSAERRGYGTALEPTAPTTSAEYATEAQYGGEGIR